MEIERPIRHGMLTKRSISKKKTTLMARFQQRWFKLTETSLSYYSSGGDKLNGTIPLESIRGCEEVDKSTFNKSRMFQVMYLEKLKLRVLYLQSESIQDLEGWMGVIRSMTEKLVVEMLEHYHKGAYLKRKWSCCKNGDKYAGGCTRTETRFSENKLLANATLRKTSTTMGMTLGSPRNPRISLTVDGRESSVSPRSSPRLSHSPRISSPKNPSPNLLDVRMKCRSYEVLSEDIFSETELSDLEEECPVTPGIRNTTRSSSFEMG